MWLIYSLSSLVLLSFRKITEKKISASYSSLVLFAGIQIVSLPILLILYAFSGPSVHVFDLSGQFYALLIFYVVCISFDFLLYYSAIKAANISYVTPLLSLAIVSHAVGNFFITGQGVSVAGAVGMGLILFGVIVASAPTNAQALKDGKKALLLALAVVLLRGIYAPTEIYMIRETTPAFFNLISTVFTIPFIFLLRMSMGRAKSNPTSGSHAIVADLKRLLRRHWLPVSATALALSLGALFTYSARIIAPNQSYVTAIKYGSIIPIALLGLFFLRERITRKQWLGMGIIAAGLYVMTLTL